MTMLLVLNAPGRTVVEIDDYDALLFVFTDGSSATTTAKRTHRARSHVIERRKKKQAHRSRRLLPRRRQHRRLAIEILSGSESVAHAHGGTR
jgi:hypothetical protein